MMMIRLVPFLTSASRVVSSRLSSRGLPLRAYASKPAHTTTRTQVAAKPVVARTTAKPKAQVTKAVVKKPTAAKKSTVVKLPVKKLTVGKKKPAPSSSLAAAKEKKEKAAVAKKMVAAKKAAAAKEKKEKDAVKKSAAKEKDAVKKAAAKEKSAVRKVVMKERAAKRKTVAMKKAAAKKTAAAKKKAAAAKKAALKKAVADRKPKTTRITAIGLFRKENSKNAAGATMGEKAKSLAAMWKALPEVEKAKYTARSKGAEGLKMRRIPPFTLYVKENYARVKDQPGSALASLAKEWKALTEAQKKAYAERTQKGEGSIPLMKKPKTPKKVTGHQLFLRENYKGAAGASVGEKAKALAMTWKGLSETQKKEYQQRADAIKPQKRAVSAYTSFVTEKLRAPKGVSAPEVMKKAAAEWKLLSDAQKNEYKSKAK